MHKSAVLLPRKFRCFAHRSPMFSFSGTAPFSLAATALHPRRPWTREEAGGKTGAEKIFQQASEKTKTRVKDGKPALFASFFLGIPQKHPNFTHRFYRRPSGGFFPGTPYPMDTCRRQSPAQQDRRPLHPMRKLWKTSRTSTKRHRSCLPSTGPLPH